MSLSKDGLVSDLDAIYSKFVRMRDSDHNGWGKCITCSRMVRWDEADCGHFISRKHLSTRYFELNTFIQCRECNRLNNGRDEKYAAELTNRYGDEFIPWLWRLAHTPVKFDRFWYNEKIGYYAQGAGLIERIHRRGQSVPGELFIWDKNFCW